jgi:NAD(P)-dependent dehydrogenase (short-subunit alcohol dehydrogenase family)
MSSNDRLAIVTGTSSGLGAAIALALLAQGWTVVGMSRRRPDLSSPGYRHIEIDLGDLPRLREIAESELAPIVAEPKWSRIGLVNNAGAIGRCAPRTGRSAAVASVFAVNASRRYLTVSSSDCAERCRCVSSVSTGAACRRSNRRPRQQQGRPAPGQLTFAPKRVKQRPAAQGPTSSSATRQVSSIRDASGALIARGTFVDFHAQGSSFRGCAGANWWSSFPATAESPIRTPLARIAAPQASHAKLVPGWSVIAPLERDAMRQALRQAPA